jgi:uncharacterized protein YdeI (YjbR/CyaY-like superfamily)
VEAVFFETPAELRAWFEANHERAAELLVGFHKVGSGRPSITWPEAVDEALCVGWIDGIRRRIDDSSYSIRFTPRRRTGIWSAVNIARVAELTAAGRMRAAGRRAFDARSEARSAIYAYERPRAALSTEEETSFQANAPAWSWFHAQAPSYQRSATYWVVSARKPETRVRRLQALIDDSAAGHTIRPLTRPTPKEAS